MWLPKGSRAGIWLQGTWMVVHHLTCAAPPPPPTSSLSWDSSSWLRSCERNKHMNVIVLL